ncbi:MAG: chemotaxis protein CheR [Spirochaetales bacterium]|nr:chemotaxis protein CheR [Spirochaetales bacterium]
MSNFYAKSELSVKEFERLSDYINDQLGIKMPITKRIMLEARLQKRLKALNIQHFNEYIEFLFSDEGQRSEKRNFLNVVTTNKTDFFRESDHFDFLVDKVLPDYYNSGVKNIRIWSSACSSGEEVYTLAIVLEEFKEKHRDFDYSILGTDISTDVLTKAKNGVYSESSVQVIAPELIKKYFKPTSKFVDPRVKENMYEVSDRLRSKVRLGRFNLMSNKYNVPGPFEIVFCRNVLIYFNRDRQVQILSNILKQLIDDGKLFLGHSESMAGINLNLAAGGCSAVYRKIGRV